MTARVRPVVAGHRATSDSTGQPLHCILQTCMRKGPVRIVEPPFSVGERRPVDDAKRPLRRYANRTVNCVQSATFGYWITSSARSSTVCGIVMPSAFAVLRLTTRSNWAGCSTGRSLAAAPLRSMSTYAAARRYTAFRLGP